jgi:Ca2+/Na+ antiporter
MGYTEFMNKNYKKIRKVYFKLLLILFVISAISLYFSKYNLYIYYVALVGITVFCALLYVLTSFIPKKPDQSIVEMFIGKSSYEQHKNLIWAISIIIFVIIMIFLIILLTEIG